MTGNERWRIRFDQRLSPRAIAAMSTVSNGWFGTRLVGLAENGDHQTVAEGLFDDQDVPDLLPGPVWTAVMTDSSMTDSSAQPVEEVTLDLARGVTERTIFTAGGSVTVRCFASVTRPALHLLQATGPPHLLADQAPLREPDLGAQSTAKIERTITGDRMVVKSPSGSAITATARTHYATSRGPDGEEQANTLRLVALDAASADDAASAVTRDSVGNTEQTPERLLAEAEALGFDRLLAEQADAWSERWQHAAIDLPAQPNLERAIRFAQYHLLSSSHSRGEAAIGPRALTGHSYRGHVFWDTDVFVVPPLAAMAPALGLAALDYRHNRLRAAQKQAADEGRLGARFPWESATTGEDVTPASGRDLRGQTLAIITGELEVHIVADVAWACQRYVDWTGDETFRRGRGAEILIETARYWQSRVEVDEDGTRHLREVIGPDEYHERVDDNVFTNEMARWNLTSASRLCSELDLCSPAERQRWLHTASALHSGFDRDQGRHVQFEGFDELQPVFPSSIGVPPIPADALLGHDRIQQTQIVKQADVLMLHFLLPDSTPPGSLDEDLDYYVPRTAHGSSLSPAITAAVLARGNRLVDAAHWFEVAATFDLIDISGTTGGGVHLATMGGLWQALTDGFLGIRPTPAGLTLDPRLPPDWGPLTLRLLFHFTPIRFDVDVDSFVVSSPEPVPIVLANGQRRSARCIKGARSFDGWEFR